MTEQPTATTDAVHEPEPPTGEDHGAERYVSPAIAPALAGETVTFDRSPQTVADDAAPAPVPAQERTETEG